jgi:hypothetical protein
LFLNENFVGEHSGEQITQAKWYLHWFLVDGNYLYFLGSARQKIKSLNPFRRELAALKVYLTNLYTTTEFKPIFRFIRTMDTSGTTLRIIWTSQG